MGKKKDICSIDELIDHLADAFIEASAENEETLREELREDGYDPNELAKEGLAFIKSLQGEERLKRAKRKREALLDLITRLGRQSGKTTTQRSKDVKLWLQEWFGSGEKENIILQAFYHKLEFVDDKDMESLAEDAEILDLLEEYERDDYTNGVDS